MPVTLLFYYIFGILKAVYNIYTIQIWCIILSIGSDFGHSAILLSVCDVMIAPGVGAQKEAQFYFITCNPKGEKTSLQQSTLHTCCGYHRNILYEWTRSICISIYYFHKPFDSVIVSHKMSIMSKWQSTIQAHQVCTSLLTFTYSNIQCHLYVKWCSTSGANQPCSDGQMTGIFLHYSTFSKRHQSKCVMLGFIIKKQFVKSF